MATIDAAFLRNRYPKLKDASDAEIARIAHQAFAPDTDYRQFETQFLGETSAPAELGKGIVRGARAIRGGANFIAGGVLDAVGLEDRAANRFRSFDEDMAANRRDAPRRGITEVRSVGDAVDAVSGLAGEALPMLASAPFGGAGVAMAGGLSSAANSVGRADQLMDPETSTASKAAAVGAMTFLGGATDALVPTRILAGTVKPGLGGVARDVALNTALGAATPLAERGVAGALSAGDFGDAAGRGGAEQIGEEVLSGGAAGGITAGIARPVMGAAQRVARPLKNGLDAGRARVAPAVDAATGAIRSGANSIAESGVGQRIATATAPIRADAQYAATMAGSGIRRAFSGFGRTSTGEVDLTSPTGEVPAFIRQGTTVDQLENAAAARGIPGEVFDPATGFLPDESGQTQFNFGPGADRGGPVRRPAADEAAQLPATDPRQLDMFPPPAPGTDRSGITRLMGDAAVPPDPSMADIAGQSRPDDPLGAMRGELPSDAAVLPGITRRPATGDPIAAMADAQVPPRPVTDLAGPTPEGAPPTYLDIAGQSRRVDPLDVMRGEPDTTAASATDRAPKGPLTTTDVLAALEGASKDTGIAAFRNDKPLGGKSKTGIRAILESKDPVAAIREAYQDGGNDKAELLDAWHERLTGEKLSAPPVAPEPAPVAQPPAAAPAAAPTPAPTPVVPRRRNAAEIESEINRLAAERGKLFTKSGSRPGVGSPKRDAFNQLTDQLQVLRAELLQTPAAPANKPDAKPADAPRIDEIQQRIDMSAARDAEIARLTEQFNDAADDQTALSNQLEALREKELAAGDEAARASVFKDIERTKAAYEQATQEATSAFDALMAAKDAPDDAFSAKFSPSADLPARAARGVIEMEAMLTRANRYLQRARTKPERERAESFQWQVKEELADNRKSLRQKGGPPASAVASLEKAVANLRAWEDRTWGKAEAPGFGPAQERTDSGKVDETPNLELATAKTVGDALRIIDKNGTPFERALIARIMPYVANAPFRVVEAGVPVPGGVPLQLRGARGVQWTNKSKGMDGVWVKGMSFGPDEQGLSNSTVLHEAIHQATVRKIELGNLKVSAGSDLAKAVADLYDLTNHAVRTAKADLASGKMPEAMRNVLANAVNNPRELVTYGLTDPRIQNWLKGVDGVQKRSMWSDFVDGIRRVLGLDVKHTSALADLLDITDRIIAAEPNQAARDAESQLVSRGQAQKIETDRMARRAEQGDMEAIGYTAGAGIARDVAQRIRDIPDNAPLEFFRKKLSLMTTTQLVEQYGNMVRGAGDLLDAMQRKFSAEYGATARADNVLKDMMSLTRRDRDQLTDVAFAATEAELHPDRPLDKQRKEPTQAEIEIHRQLETKYNALSPEAKESYQSIRKVMDDQFTEVVSALRRLVDRVEPDPNARRDRHTQIDKMIGKTRGPYFPMSRFGDYVTIAKNAAADGRSIVQHFDTAAEQERGRQEMIRSGIKPDAIVMTLRSENRLQQEVSTPFVESIRTAIDNTIDDPTQRAAMTQALNELVIRALPAASGAKNFIRRRKVEGYSTDAARSIADSVLRAGRYVANLNFSPDMNAAVSSLKPFHRANAEQMPMHAVVYTKDGVVQVEMHASAAERLRAVDRLMGQGLDTETVRATLGGMPEKLAAAGVPPELIEPALAQGGQLREAALVGGDVRRAQAVSDHLSEKAAALTAPSSESQVFRALGQLAHIKYLGLSPAYWLTNLAQIPTMTFSHLGGRYGVGRTAAAIGKAIPASSVAFKLMLKHLSSGTGTAIELGDLRNVTPDEREALQFMADRGQLDITQNNDLAQVARGEGSVRRTAVEYITAGAHYTEIFNRMVTGLAAYRLARDSGMQHQAAMRQSLDDVEATQFNYAEYNKPMVMSRGGPFGAPARLIFMFQQYAQNTLYWWGRNIQKSAGNDPQQQAEANKAMAIAAAGLATMGGLAGLPLMGTIHMLANMMFSGDDPGWDAEDEIAKAIEETTGSKTASKVMTRGLFAAGGTDLSARLGQGDLLSKIGLTQQQAERRELSTNPEQQFFMDLIGPVGSMAGDIPRAIDAAKDGDMYKLFTLVPVKGLADVARAADYSANGVRNRAGDVLLGADELSQADIALKASGFQPGDVQDMYKQRNAIRLLEQRAADNRSRIAHAVARGLLAGDDEALRDGLEKLQKYNASVAEKYPQLMLTGPAMAESVKRIVTEQAMLQLTGGVAKNQRALMLALQLNPGLQVGATVSEDEADAGN